MQENTWVELAGTFVLGIAVGIGFMTTLRNYYLRDVLRLKGQLADERRALWEELKRAH